jgi:hypothetical protein
LISDLKRLFQISTSGRKLHKQRADHANGVEQEEEAAAVIQAGIYLRGLMKTPPTSSMCSATPVQTSR